ncbi:MAG: hypothetical protein VX225_02680 [Pseudomonadota bacterium]|nr:hypothetical protein [Pseudomonadota bacterium]
MKPTLFGLITVFFAISATGEAQARLSLPKAGVNPVRVVINNADAGTVARLKASQDAINTARDTVGAYKKAGDKEATKAALKDLRSKQRERDKFVRKTISGSDDLQAALQAEVKAARVAAAKKRATVRKNVGSRIAAAATADQQASLEANKSAIGDVIANLRAAREGGASKADTQDLRKQLAGLQKNQKQVVGEILKANEALSAELKSEAKGRALEARRSVKGQGKNRRNVRQRRAAKKS